MRWILILTVFFVGCSHGVCLEPVDGSGELHYDDVKQAYTDNTVVAEKAYVGRRYRITGTVSGVQDGFVWLGESVSLMVPENSLEYYSKGQSVTIECRLNSVVQPTVSLDFQSCTPG